MRAPLFIPAIAFGVAVVLAACSPAQPPAATGDGTVPTGGVLVGPCLPEGAVRACDVQLGEQNGVITCFVGHQDCRGGSWSACTGAGGVTTLRSLDTGALRPGGALHLDGLSAAKPDAGACANPCDPFCWGYDEIPDAGLLAEGGASGAGTSWLSFVGAAPPGFADKEICGTCNPPPGSCNGQTHCNMYDACQADFHCNTATNTCDPPTPGWTWPAATCAGIDLTVGASCEDEGGSGKEGFTICNRGNTKVDHALYPSVGVYFKDGSAFDWSCPVGACANHAPTCTVAFTQDLLPGTCTYVGELSSACIDANWKSGNTSAYVNSDGAIPECAGPSCRNNYADVKKGDVNCASVSPVAMAPKSYGYTYDATCPVGTHPVWANLAWSATLPCSPGACTGSNSSTVEFDAQAQQRLVDGGLGAYQPSTIATIAFAPASMAPAATPSIGYPAACPMSGTAGCPAAFSPTSGATTGGLGGKTASTDEHLSMTIKLSPSPDKKVGPTLSFWQVTYSCQSAE